MERYGEALHHFEAAEAIFDARDVMVNGMGQQGSPRNQIWIIFSLIMFDMYVDVCSM